MKVHDARFLKSASGRDSWPEDALCEVAFAGRSNVGKSSLINTLTGRKTLARVSSTPGRTRQLNFIDVDVAVAGSRGTVRLADLPGYGWARVSKSERARWAPMIETYLRDREALRLVVLIIDIRHTPTELDRQMLDWLGALERPGLVVATKADKLGKNRRAAAVAALKRDLGIPVVPFSSETGEGRDAVWRAVTDVCLPVGAA